MSGCITKEKCARQQQELQAEIEQLKHDLELMTDSRDIERANLVGAVRDYRLIKAERDALAKDAERYRCIREKLTGDSWDIALSIWRGVESGDWEWPTTTDEVDAVIDAVMQEATNA